MKLMIPISTINPFNLIEIVFFSQQLRMDSIYPNCLDKNIKTKHTTIYKIFN